MKFVITHWTDEFDLDGVENHFAILGEFHDLAEARTYLNGCVDRLTAEQLGQHTSWHVMSIQGKERAVWKRVNKNNTVVDFRSCKVGDGTNFFSIYNYLELIELPDDAVVDKNLFDLEHCELAVRSYFEGEGYFWRE